MRRVGWPLGVLLWALMGSQVSHAVDPLFALSCESLIAESGAPVDFELKQVRPGENTYFLDNNIGGHQLVTSTIFNLMTKDRKISDLFGGVDLLFTGAGKSGLDRIAASPNLLNNAVEDQRMGLLEARLVQFIYSRTNFGLREILFQMKEGAGPIDTYENIVFPRVVVEEILHPMGEVSGSTVRLKFDGAEEALMRYLVRHQSQEFLNQIAVANIKHTEPNADFIRQLEAVDLGGSKGINDRKIIAEVFQVAMETKTTPTFVTSDTNILRGLLRLKFKNYQAVDQLIKKLKGEIPYRDYRVVDDVVVRAAETCTHSGAKLTECLMGRLYTFKDIPMQSMGRIIRINVQFYFVSQFPELSDFSNEDIFNLIWSLKD